MKFKHNKKRNTAFLYEALIQEYTKAIINTEPQIQKNVKNILKEFFSKGKVLHEELQIYNALLDSDLVDRIQSRRLMYEVKKDFLSLNRKKAFNQQTKLLKRIHESLSNKFFATFLSNYRTIATVGSFFNSEPLPAPQRILLEDKMLDLITRHNNEASNISHVDDLTFRTFTKKFNEAYKHKLRKEQKTLLTHYITSFADNGLCMKAFMNEEIGRLKTEVSYRITKENYNKQFKLVLEKLNSYSTTPINDEMIKEVFYIQDLIYEVSKNGN